MFDHGYASFATILCFGSVYNSRVYMTTILY